MENVYALRHHASFERLVLLDFRLTCRTGLHIGAGKTGALVGSDLPVLRDAQGRPLIPGSSLRGVLRSGIEALSAAVDLQRLTDPGEVPEGTPPEEVRLHEEWRKLKLVERLFGAAADSPGGFSYGSRLQISDACCQEEVAVELRDGVAISRDTRTVSGSAKFDVEVVPAGTTFKGSVRIKNPADFEVGLLAQALWALDQGVLLLGGKAARGLGWMSVEVTEPKMVTALDLLGGTSGTPLNRTLGPVEERLGSYLAALREIVQPPALAGEL